jgi:hypothetical protein
MSRNIKITLRMLVPMQVEVVVEVPDGYDLERRGAKDKLMSALCNTEDARYNWQDRTDRTKIEGTHVYHGETDEEAGMKINDRGEAVLR